MSADDSLTAPNRPIWLLAAVGLLFGVIAGLIFFAVLPLAEKFMALALAMGLTCVSLALITGANQVSLGEASQKSPLFNFVLALGLTILLFISNRVFTGHLDFFRLIAWALASFLWLKTFVLGTVRGSISNWKKNLLTVVFVPWFLFLIAEIAFIFVAEPHGSYHEGLAAIKWQKRYFKTNSDGFRMEKSCFSGQSKTVSFWGDSFTAGAGIRKARDCFPAIVGDLLPQKQVATCNFGVPGDNTPETLERLQAHLPSSAQGTAIISWVPNDIQPAAESQGLVYPWKPPMKSVPFWAKYPIEYSHVLNYLFAIRGASGGQVPYANYLSDTFGSPAVMDAHFAEWAKIKDFFDARPQMDWVVVIFPLMQSMEETVVFEGKMATWFAENEIRAIRVSPLLEGLSTEDLIVNPRDPHPSEEVHRRVAEAIAKQLQSR